MMAKVDLWMPLYIGDYYKDTLRLTTQQHGAYLLLLMEYWMNGGPLPDDDEEFAAITKLSVGEWRKARKKLARFFIVENGEWRQPRADRELADAKRRRDAAAENGKKGGRPRKPQNPDETHGESQEKPTGYPTGSDPVSKNPGFKNPDHNPQKTSSPSPPPSNTPYPGTDDPPNPLRSEGLEEIPFDSSAGEVLPFKTGGGQ